MAISLVAVLATTAHTHAAAQAQADGTQYKATVYGWFPGLSVTTEFPSGAGGPSINVDADDLLEDLEMAFMGTFEVQSGRWGGLVDWAYTDVGSDKSGTRSLSIHGQPLAAGVTANLSLDVKTNILTLAGTYSLVNRPDYSAGVVFGARMLDMDQTLNWSIVGTGSAGLARTGTSEVSTTSWDAIIGVRGRPRFGEDLRWFMPYYADIGTGDSRMTWQGTIGLGYSFSWGDVLAVWRYLDYDFDAGEHVQSLTFSGVAVGVSFRF